MYLQTKKSYTDRVLSPPHAFDSRLQMGTFCSERFDVSDGIESIPVLAQIGLDKKDVTNFKYCRVNIPGPGCELGAFEEQFEGCGCVGICDLKSCPCLQRFQKSYDSEGRLLLPLNSWTSTELPIVECNRSCTCSNKCCHRLVQHGVQYHLEIFDTNVKGLGLRTMEKIKRNSFVCEYAGEVLSLEESQQRAASQTPIDKNYILVVNEHCKNGVWRTCVDPEHLGNVGRFINHSCDPNLCMIPVRVDNNVPKLSLFALNDIQPGEELTFSYSDNAKTKEDLGKISCDLELKKCMCGTQKCNGYLPFDTSLYENAFK